MAAAVAEDQVGGLFSQGQLWGQPSETNAEKIFKTYSYSYYSVVPFTTTQQKSPPCGAFFLRSDVELNHRRWLIRVRRQTGRKPVWTHAVRPQGEVQDALRQSV